ncbi:MAG: hypothetical protein ACRD9Y_12700, partial [Blastocatellia bacterium]
MTLSGAILHSPFSILNFLQGEGFWRPPLQKIENEKWRMENGPKRKNVTKAFSLRHYRFPLSSSIQSLPDQ